MALLGLNQFISIPVPIFDGEGPVIDVSALGADKTFYLAGDFIGTYTILGSHDDVRFVPVLFFTGGVGPQSIRTNVSCTLKSIKVLRSANAPATIGVAAEGTNPVSPNVFLPFPAIPPGATGAQPILDPPGIDLDKDLTIMLSGGQFVGQISIEAATDVEDWVGIAQFDVDSAVGRKLDLKIFKKANVVARRFRAVIEKPTTIEKEVTISIAAQQNAECNCGGGPEGFGIVPLMFVGFIETDEGEERVAYLANGTGLNAPSIPTVNTEIIDPLSFPMVNGTIWGAHVTMFQNQLTSPINMSLDLLVDSVVMETIPIDETTTTIDFPMEVVLGFGSRLSLRLTAPASENDVPVRISVSLDFTPDFSNNVHLFSGRKSDASVAGSGNPGINAFIGQTGETRYPVTDGLNPVVDIVFIDVRLNTRATTTTFDFLTGSLLQDKASAVVGPGVTGLFVAFGEGLATADPAEIQLRVSGDGGGDIEYTVCASFTTTVPDGISFMSIIKLATQWNETDSGEATRLQAIYDSGNTFLGPGDGIVGYSKIFESIGFGSVGPTTGHRLHPGRIRNIKVRIGRTSPFEGAFILQLSTKNPPAYPFFDAEYTMFISPVSFPVQVFTDTPELPFTLAQILTVSTRNSESSWQMLEMTMEYVPDPFIPPMMVSRKMKSSEGKKPGKLLLKDLRKKHFRANGRRLKGLKKP